MARRWAVAAALVCLAQTGAARNACEVLTKKDLDFASTKLSQSTREQLAISQCFYQAPAFANSVSLTLITGSDTALNGYWKGDASQEDQDIRTVEVDGVGDEALWSGNRINGALYVRTRGAILRISPGGAGDTQAKIDRSKSLAKLALKRL